MAKRYRIPIEETDEGKRTMLLSLVVRDLAIETNQSVMMYYTPDQPVATLYVFDELSEIAAWLQSDRTNRIGFVQADDTKASTPKDDTVVIEGVTENPSPSANINESSS